jgi:hypothetical protein
MVKNTWLEHVSAEQAVDQTVEGQERVFVMAASNTSLIPSLDLLRSDFQMRLAR